MKRNIPEVFLGALMAVAIFAMGFVVASSLWSPQPIGSQSQQIPQGEEEKGQQPKSFWQRTADDPVAFFTLWIMLFTGAVVVANIGLWIVTRRTLGHNRSATNKQLRAYIHITDIALDHFDDEWSPIIRIKFQNYGQTPAYEVRNRCSSSLVFVGKPNVEAVREKISGYSDLGPSQHKSTTMIVPREAWQGLMKHPIQKRFGTFYAFGEIAYFDAFQDRTSDQPHYTRYRFRLHVDDDGNAGFSFDDEGNESN